jgi:hypothetical protein
MSRWVFLLGVGLAVVALAFAVTDWMIRPTPCTMETNARWIRAGMTLSQVNAILCRPCDGTDQEDEKGRPYFSALWVCEAGCLRVIFDDDGRVERVELERVNWDTWWEQPPSLRARLRSWLGW